jgi:hypothetical protein
MRVFLSKTWEFLIVSVALGLHACGCHQAAEENKVDEWVNDFSDPVTSDKLDREVAAEADMRETAKRFASINDPKMQNSEFFKLMQKLSTGEVAIEGEKMVQREGANSNGWAEEFEQQHPSNTFVIN